MKAELLHYIDKKGNRQGLPVDKYPTCPFCEQIVEANPLFVNTRSLFDEDDNYCGELAAAFFQCKKEQCSSEFIADFYLDPNSIQEEPFTLSQTNPPQPIPELSALLNKPNIGQDIKDDLKETGECLKHWLFQAFGAAARRTIHSVCAERGAEGNDLKQQIEYLEDNGAFSTQIADRAHEIRTFGRNGAHPEFEKLTRLEAENGLKNLLWIIQEVYKDLPPPDLGYRNKQDTRRYSIPKKKKKTKTVE